MSCQKHTARVQNYRGQHVVRLAFVEKGPITIAGFCSRVSLPEEPPTAPPQNVIASGRTNQSIMIQWQPPPESHQNGILKGYIIRYRAILGPGGFPDLSGLGKGSGLENSADPLANIKTRR